MKTWLSYLIPQKIAEYTTPYNRYIRINRESGKMKLLVNGSPQSGPYIDTLWEAAFGAFGISFRTQVKKVLVLGVAGGTVIHMVHTLFPEAEITGVEIDATMIGIGKKYFSLDTIHSLHIVCEDAKVFVVAEEKKGHSYDLVIMDMFFGRVIPAFILEDPFLGNVKKIVRENGCLVINYLRELEYQKRSDTFMMRLQSHFPVVRDHVIYRNRFFFCSIV